GAALASALVASAAGFCAGCSSSSSGSAWWRGRKAEGRAFADLGLRIDETAGLFDDAVDGREAETGALADLLGREERLEALVQNVRRDAGPSVGDLDQHIVGRRHALVSVARAVSGSDVRGAHPELAAVRHGIAGVDREIDDHLLELREV